MNILITVFILFVRRIRPPSQEKLCEHFHLSHLSLCLCFLEGTTLPQMLYLAYCEIEHHVVLGQPNNTFRVVL